MDVDRISKLSEELFEQKDFKPSSIGITSRQINYWIDNDLVPFVARRYKGEEKVKKIRLDTYQAIWALIIKEFLEIGVSVKKLKDLAYDVWQLPREIKYADKVLKGHLEKNPYGLTVEQLDKVRKDLKDELLMENYYRILINPFTDTVKYASIKEGYPHSLIYAPKTGEHIFYYGSKAAMYDMHSLFSTNSIITIPIFPILSKVVDNIPQKDKSLQYLSSKEDQIRKILVYKKPRAVYLAFENQNIKPIYLREQHRKPDELARFILENDIRLGDSLVVQKRAQGNYKTTLIRKEK